MQYVRSMFFALCAIAMAMFSAPAFADSGHTKEDVTKGIGKMRVPFIANEGQMDERVAFYADTFGGTVYVTKKGEIVYSLPKYEKDGSEGEEKELSPHKRHEREMARHEKPRSVKGVVLREEIAEGFKPDVAGGKKAQTKVNYFKGSDPEQWRSNIPTYKSISLGEIYPGVKLELKAYGNNIEKIFLVEPGIDPSVIQLKLSGATGITVDEQGELAVATDMGPASFTAPLAYQYIDGKKGEVQASYAIKEPDPLKGEHGLVYGFQVGGYDATRELIIDPLLASTYLGGSSSGDIGYSIAVDGSGAVYVTGYTVSSGFPTTSGAYDTSYSDSDVFVAKLDSSLSASPSPPTATTGSASDITGSGATLKGTVNANGASTTAWFQYGTTSGSYSGTSTTQSVSGSGNTTVSIGISGLSSGTTYYYRIAAQNSAGTSYGSEASFTTSAPSDTTPPTVSSTSPAGNATGVGVSSAISATFSEDMNSSTITTSTFTLASSSGVSVSGTVSYSNKVATFTPSGNLSYSTIYTATITTGVKDLGGNAMSSNYTWSFTTGSAPDTTAPSGSIIINSGASYANSTAVTLNLSATDGVGVVGYYTSTSSSTPTASASGWNSVTSATSDTGSVSYTIASGDEQKTVYVWYKDAAGNVSSQASDSITLDTTAPIVTITSPTSSDTYTATSSTVSLSGSASDSSSGVKEVTWSNDKGGSGTASGTTYWSISSISLSSGDNKITVTAKDNAGNTSTDIITVTYSASKAPTVTTGSATNVIATQATLTGTVNANGQSTTAWFEYGTIKGTYGSKSSSQTVTGSNDTTVSITISGLTSGTTYYYRIAAQNNSGTSYGEEMSFQYNQGGSAPTVTTESATDVTTTTATLNGTVNANGISTTAWFEYGAISGSYGKKTTTKAVTGSTDTEVGISISGLTSGTTYYYRIVAQNSVGTTYGKEMSFYYSTEKKAPTVETESATNVTATSATLTGSAIPTDFRQRCGLSTERFKVHISIKQTPRA